MFTISFLFIVTMLGKVRPYEFDYESAKAIDNLVQVREISKYTSLLEIGSTKVYFFDTVPIQEPKAGELHGDNGSKVTDTLRSKSSKFYSCVNCKFAERIRKTV